MLALAMMISLAPQGVLAGDLTASAPEVQEAYGAGSVTDSGSPETETESGVTLDTQNGTENGGEENAQPGTDTSGDSGTDFTLSV